MKLFDWFTVLAQIVNFLVLVFLLKHFLYGRILNAIDSREKSIRARLDDAEQKVHEAGEAKEAYDLRLHELEARREQMLSECRNEVEQKRMELMRVAREQIVALEERWRDDLVRERNALFQDIRGRAAGEILAVVRRALHELARCDLDQCAARVFLAKLASLSPEAWRELAGQPIVVLSASALPDETRHEIEEVLARLAIRPASLRFEQAESLGWGLELRANGRKIAWSAEGYVDALEERLREALEKKAGEVSRTVAT
jgi:F-type H+-transporting ATPase subunit b